jgi:smad nuclear-interacting protein 1
MQFRTVDRSDEFGIVKSLVVPYLMDLGSVNGTFLNGSKIDEKRYYELREKDMIKFGLSSREYLVLHDKSQDEE